MSWRWFTVVGAVGAVGFVSCFSVLWMEKSCRQVAMGAGLKMRHDSVLYHRVIQGSKVWGYKKELTKASEHQYG
ncbi:hypothetical protein [Peribacillus muralis]|uniref:hypothetical protein n=1 Tax=Peribacillus muralis TaxID=264697 RepID=UPI00128FAC15|nr:hypothetical protein [Peribacillus muralis]